MYTRKYTATERIQGRILDVICPSEIYKALRTKLMNKYEPRPGYYYSFTETMELTTVDYHWDFKVEMREIAKTDCPVATFHKMMDEIAPREIPHIPTWEQGYVLMSDKDE